MHGLRILDRYILRELVVPFLLSLATLTLVFFIQKMFRLAELVVSKGATFYSTLKLFLYIMPGFLIITIPMATLVASVSAFGRMSSDSEIVAMKASRISLYSMLRPVALFSLFTFLTTAVISLVILPDANRAMKEHLFAMVRSRALVGIEEGVFTDTFDGIVIYVDRMKSLDDMQGIFISDERSSSSPLVITARRGRLIADPDALSVVMSLEEGDIHAQAKDEGSYSLSHFARGSLYLDISQALLPKGTSEKEYKEINTLRLLREARRLRQEGKPSMEMEGELQTRLTVPFACLLFGIMGAPLGIRRSRSAKSVGITIALGVFLAYYVLLGAGKSLAEAGALSPAAAYWIPNALMAVAAALMTFIRGHEIDMGIMHMVIALFRRTKKESRLPS